MVWVDADQPGRGAFPITFSTTMDPGYNTAVVNGWNNLWGESLQYLEQESEHSSSSPGTGTR